MTDATMTKPDDYFCSIESRSHDEPLLGSAPRADVWFMLEYGGRWGSKAFNESDIADSLKAKVNEQLDQIPNSRLLLIKQGAVDEEHIAFFAAVSVAEEPRLYRFSLKGYEQLLELDLEAIADGREKYADAIVGEPLLVVCTNGLRDQCCALNGTKAYQALSAQFGDVIWQSTHHGGHRFGANMLAMPQGLSYGRVDVSGGAEAVQATLDDKVWLDNLRGRSTYDKVVQAAEGLVRRQAGLLGVEDLELADIEPQGDDLTRVTFQERHDGQVHQVTVKTHISQELIFAACVGEKLAPLVEYELTDYSVQ